MKTRIDFFRDDLRPKIVLINLNFVMLLAMLSFAFIMGMWFWSNSQIQQATQEIDYLLADVERKKFLVDSLIEAKDSRSQDHTIVASVEKHQQELDVKLTILDQLSHRETQKINGFSKLMLDLAANHPSNLWLTQILLDERKLFLEGTATDSTALPKWIGMLNQAEYFYGKEFAGARINRIDNDQLRFVLSSELDDVKKGAE
ncbi:PilN domain-containing protein [Aliiglaciecola sp. LCG003]|uniref:PilN domain-containing protein n=1 Tax=Aliiglaciecola sp. LCG003 TaxID=3053655 RepID=UPI0025727B8B|nr:PilN domain-containing protein [Aliiglaciecola sp. LCG003]WJG09700.1 PilN domain-containing protein [Aliiglaciecola sp. LCG003]